MIRNVEITIESGNLSVFQGLLAYGFKLEVNSGASLYDLLCRQIGIKEAYLSDRIQTIFLNNKVIDDISGEIVKDGSVIALSAAMPGLVGAVFRKGGMLSSLRYEIKNQKTDATMAMIRGHVTLKLFNLVASDLGPAFLKNGIQVQGEHFFKYLNRRISKLKSICCRLRIDGGNFELDEALSVGWQDGDVCLSVHEA